MDKAKGQEWIGKLENAVSGISRAPLPDRTVSETQQFLTFLKNCCTTIAEVKSEIEKELKAGDDADSVSQ